MNSTNSEFFRAEGYLRLPGFVPKARWAGLRKKILEEATTLLASHVGRTIRKLPTFQQITRLSSLVSAREVHAALMTRELTDEVTQLAGGAPSHVQEAQLLLSPPQQGEWSLDGLNWHVDLGKGSHERTPGVQAFFLLDDVAPRGGATLALAGSHRIPSGSRESSALRSALRGGESRQRELEELGVSLLEMSGRMGDVFLMDMRVLHTPSINTTKNLRLMATCRFLF